jgi:uncharacterized lipoprotein
MRPRRTFRSRPVGLIAAALAVVVVAGCATDSMVARTLVRGQETAAEIAA